MTKQPDIHEDEYNDAMDTIAAFKKARAELLSSLPDGINGIKLSSKDNEEMLECVAEAFEEAYWNILNSAKAIRDAYETTETLEHERLERQSL